MVRIKKIKLRKYAERKQEWIRSWYLRVYLLGLFFDVPLN